MENNLYEGLEQFYGYVNWLFIIVFILSAWIMNDSIEAKNKVIKLNWFEKIPKIIRSLFIGIIWAVFFYWAFGYDNRKEVTGLVFSMLMSMVLYKCGIDYILKLISKKILGFDFSKDDIKT